jgi:hypothetical protein
VVIGVRFFVDEPLRQTVERNVNKALDGYTVQIRALRFQPLGFSLHLIDSEILQNTHPDLPVAYLPKVSASIHWRSLLKGRLVADFLFDRPTLHINLQHATSEIKDKVPIDERGWQDALEEIYPLKVNEFTVRDATITYLDDGPFKPLRLSHVNLRARNIRNVHSKDHVYPSDIHVESQVFDAGAFKLNGHANFLAKPHAGIKAKYSLEGVDLDYFKPIIRRYFVSVRGGKLSSDGSFEYAPKTKVVDLQHITVRGVHIDYIHEAKTEAAEKQLAIEIGRSAKRMSNNPEILLRVDKVNILKSTFAYVNKAAAPDYRIFLTGADLRLENFSNQGADGVASGALNGRFMGSGNAAINVTFRPKTKGPDFDVEIGIEETQLSTMNDFWRAYGNFDVVDGRFSLYSEFSIRNGAIRGYVKPLLKDMDVYDAAQDGNKSFFQAARERFVGLGAWLLQNRARNEVGTKVTITGRIDSPQYSTWEALLEALKNAFVRSLSRGLEKQTDPDGYAGEREIPS